MISAPYTRGDLAQGSLGILGPTRMQYERAISALRMSPNFLAKRWEKSIEMFLEREVVMAAERDNRDEKQRDAMESDSLARMARERMRMLQS